MRSWTGFLGLAASATSLVACGARSDLLDYTGESGGASSMGAAPPCVSWTPAPGGAVAVTDPGTAARLTDVVAEGDRVFVGFANDDDSASRVRVVSADLANIGASQVIIAHPEGAWVPGPRLDIGHGHRGAMAWDSTHGTQFVPIAPDGAAAAAPVPITKQEGRWLFATSAGFAAIVSNANEGGPFSLLSLDASGNITGEKNHITPKVPQHPDPVARARLDDGSLLLAWNMTTDTLTVQRFSDAGDALSMPVDSAMGFAFALAPVGSSVLEAAVPYTGDRVLVRPLDANGASTGSWTTLWTLKSGATVGGVDVAPVGDGALVAFTAEKLRILQVTAAGAQVGAPIGVPAPTDDPSHLSAVRLAITRAGIVVVFESETLNTPRQVFVTRLVCAG